MTKIFGALILLVFICLMFTVIENKSYYIIYGSVIIYCIINLNKDIES